MIRTRPRTKRQRK